MQHKLILQFPCAFFWVKMHTLFTHTAYCNCVVNVCLATTERYAFFGARPWLRTFLIRGVIYGLQI